VGGAYRSLLPSLLENVKITGIHYRLKGGVATSTGGSSSV